MKKSEYYCNWIENIEIDLVYNQRKAEYQFYLLFQ